MDDFKGFSLFADVDDLAMQEFNRARVLLNMVVDNQSNGKFNAKAVALSAGYLKALPQDKRAGVLREFRKLMAKEGFIIEAKDEAKAQYETEKVING